MPDKSENVRGASINPLAKTAIIPKVDNSLQDIKLTQVKADDSKQELSPRFSAQQKPPKIPVSVVPKDEDVGSPERSELKSTPERKPNAAEIKESLESAQTEYAMVKNKNSEPTISIQLDDSRKPINESFGLDFSNLNNMTGDQSYHSKQSNRSSKGGKIKDTRAELQSQIKKLAETMRRQQYQKQLNKN